MPESAMEKRSAGSRTSSRNTPLATASAMSRLHDEKSSNVIPFMKLVEIDFTKQLPDWYEEPQSQFNYKIA